MASKIDTVENRTLVSNLDDKSSSSKVPSKEPTLKLNMEEYREMRRLENAGDVVGVEDLKKKVRQRMELELASDPTKTATTSIVSKKILTSKQAKSTSTSNSNGNISVKNDKNTPVNHKRTEITTKNGNMVCNEDSKVAVKKVKPIPTTTSRSTGEILTINKEKHKEKSKFSASASKINHGSNKEKVVTTRQEYSTSTSKGINGILPDNKGRQAAVNKGKTGKVSSSTSGLVTNKSVLKLEKYIERWKSCRESGERYKPLELFLPPEILNDKNMVVTVEKIAKDFELERLRRLLEQDKEKPNGNKKLAQKRIENFNNFGKNYTRLEIAAVRNDDGPKKDQQIRAHIDFLNEKNIIKNKKVTSLDVIQDPYYLRKGLEQFQKISQRKEVEKQKDLERKRKLEGTWEFKRKEKLEDERKHKPQQKLKVERKSVKLEGKFAEQRRHITETKRRQEIERERARKAEIRHRNNRIEDLRNSPKKIMTNRSDALKSTSLKKRTFDERSEVSHSSRAPKKRNFGGGELDISGLDEETVNQNMSSIIHSIFRQGRRPMYGMVDDNDDDDAMEVAGYDDVRREEARSSRLARKEDEEEERRQQQRIKKKFNRKKA